MKPISEAQAPIIPEGISVRRDQGLIFLSSAAGCKHGRVLYTNSYGGEEIWDRVVQGFLPPHHLWGCLELTQMGYEVVIAPPLNDFYLHRNPLPHDLRFLKTIRSWLGRDGVIYCGHNVLYWLPFLRALGLLKNRIVSLIFGREPLALSKAHSGIIALNGAAASHARQLAPRVPMAQLAWGVDLRTFPRLSYDPQWFLACGQTCRDHPTLAAATQQTTQSIQVISPKLPHGLSWSPQTRILTGGSRDDTVTYEELFHKHYAACTASLIILNHDPEEKTGVGFTNLLEAMAMARPVVVTRTGALPSEIDVEKAGCGLHVPPNDPAALAKAIDFIAAHPERAREMGARGRKMCEDHYNIQRYASELHRFFQSL